ncbi:MAG: hypothetical protein LBO71_05110 [Prevotellaceae bacterium]|jgi:hypothetical protein|nr:hypothetical protein [Prevotellaceae bacterium]
MIERKEINRIAAQNRMSDRQIEKDSTKLMEKVLSKEAMFKRDWNKKLSSQIHDIPDFDAVFREAKRHLKL